MTQKLTDDAVRNLVSIHGVKDDLLSLRAAVRRVHAAEDAFERARVAGEPTEKLIPLAQEHQQAYDALRAEMGGIDKDEGGAS